MSLTRLAVHRPRVILLLLAMITLAGLVSLRQLSQDFLPQVNLPVVTVAGRRDLPSAILEPSVGKLAITDLPVLTLALASPNASATSVYSTADETVRRELETVEGVGSVRVLGGRKPEIHVTVDPDRLRC